MKCIVCKKELVGQQTKFCSKKCCKIFYRNKDTYYEIECQICGKKHMSTKKNGKYCSSKCRGISRKKYINIPDCLDRADRKIDKNLGYVRIYCPMHPKANTRGYVYEHRLVAEYKIGRLLTKDEHVHHKDGIRWNNHPDNLVIMSNKDHGYITQYENQIYNDKMTSEELKKIIEYFKDIWKKENIRPNLKKTLGEDIVIKSSKKIKPKKKKRVNIVKKIKIKKKFLSVKKIQKYKSVVYEGKFYIYRSIPSKRLLQKQVWQFPVTYLSQLYKVSDSMIIKWCRKLGIDKPNRGYWTTMKYK